MVLIGKRSLGLAHQEDCIKSIQINTNKINKYLINHAFGSDEIRYLIKCPRTLTGIIVGRIEKMFTSMQLGKNNTKRLGKLCLGDNNFSRTTCS